MSWSGPAYTPVNIPPVPEPIRYADGILMIGSCFAEHIANKLSRFKYDLLQNPFGILYNPTSLAESISRIVEKKYYSSDELVVHDGLYHSLDHHGSYSGVNAEDVILSINKAIDTAHHHLSGSRFIFISPGTTWVYRYKLTGKLVGNCHKIPQTQFEKSKLTYEETQGAFERIYNSIKGISPSGQIIWTISPVRHIRDGLVENQRSKAALILAAEWMTKQYSDCFYFPAYEIMMDQLRDYRYYANDLIHPSEAAIDIIWEMFCEHYIDQNELKVHALIERIHQSMNHRFLHARLQAMADFATVQLELIERTNKMIPALDFTNEKIYFRSLIPA
jgi:hypothetical protein